MPDNITSAVAAGGTPNAVPITPAIIEVYSREILFQAQPLLRFEQIASRKEELSVMPGRTINFLRYAALTGDAALEENVDMETDNLTASQIQIIVSEHGKALQVTEFALRTAFTDILSDSATMLGHHMAKYRDGMIRDELLTASNIVYAGTATDRPGLGLTDYFDTEMVKDMVEILATNKAPKINGDAYICFIHPHQARRLRDDDDWVDASHYGAPDQIFRGEIGRYEDVRFIETTMIPYVDDAGNIWADGMDTGEDTTNIPATDVDAYRAVMVGDHAIGLAVSLEAELRDDGVHDFGRRHKLAWYGIWGVGLIEGGHVVIGESA